MLAYIRRAVWGARGRAAARVGIHRRIIVHTEAGAAMPASATVAQERARMRAIDAYHMSLGWSGGVGYLEAWFPSGRVYEGRGRRRAGAHTVGLNDELGVVVPGHGDRDPMTAACIAAGRASIADAIAAGDLVADYQVSGHRDHIPPGTKSCPGSKIYPQLRQLRGVGTTAAPPRPTPAPATSATVDLEDLMSSLTRPAAERLRQFAEAMADQDHPNPDMRGVDNGASAYRQLIAWHRMATRAGLTEEDLYLLAGLRDGVDYMRPDGVGDEPRHFFTAGRSFAMAALALWREAGARAWRRSWDVFRENRRYGPTDL